MTIIGEVGGDALDIAGRLNLAVSELRAAHEHGLPNALQTHC